MKTVIPIDIVKLGEDNSYHLFVDGFIDDCQHNLLIDTGASHSIFDPMIIPELPADDASGKEIQSTGINEGDLNCKLGCVKKFKLGDLICENLIVVLIDLSHVNNLYEKLTVRRVVGLIGSDFLLKYNAIIDYKRQELVLRNIKKSS